MFAIIIKRLNIYACVLRCLKVGMGVNLKLKNYKCMREYAICGRSIYCSNSYTKESSGKENKCVFDYIALVPPIEQLNVFLSPES